MNWNYNQANYNEQSYNLLNQGNYKVRIMSVRETIAKNGNEGLEITFEVDGHNNKLKYFIWYNRDCPANTDRKLGELFESFAITIDERSYCESWVGKTGAVNVIHDDYKGHKIAKVAFCIKRDVQSGMAHSPNNDFMTIANTGGQTRPTFNGFVTPVREITDFNF